MYKFAINLRKISLHGWMDGWILLMPPSCSSLRKEILHLTASLTDPPPFHLLLLLLCFFLSTHFITSPLLCIIPLLPPAQTCWCLSLTPARHNPRIISDLMEVAIFCRGNNAANEQHPLSWPSLFLSPSIPHSFSPSAF